MDDNVFEPLDSHTDLLQKYFQNSQELAKIKSILGVICTNLSDLHKIARSDAVVQRFDNYTTGIKESGQALNSAVLESKMLIHNGGELINSMKNGFFECMDSLSRRIESIELPGYQEVVKQTIRQSSAVSQNVTSVYEKLLQQKDRLITIQRETIQELKARAYENMDKKNSDKLDRIIEQNSAIDETMGLITAVMHKARDTESRMAQVQLQYNQQEKALSQVREENRRLRLSLTVKEEECRFLERHNEAFKKTLETTEEHKKTLHSIKNVLDVIECGMKSHNMDRQENIAHVIDMIDRLQLSVTQYHNSQSGLPMEVEEIVTNTLSQKVVPLIDNRLEGLSTKFNNLEASLSQKGTSPVPSQRSMTRSEIESQTMAEPQAAFQKPTQNESPKTLKASSSYQIFRSHENVNYQDSEAKEQPPCVEPARTFSRYSYRFPRVFKQKK